VLPYDKKVLFFYTGVLLYDEKVLLFYTRVFLYDKEALLFHCWPLNFKDLRRNIRFFVFITLF